jgi:hypothetical protein
MLAGCVERYPIRPTQLEVFNDTPATTHTRRLVKLELIDGRIVEINPYVVVYVTTSDGDEHEFYSPLKVEFDDGYLTIRSAYSRPGHFEAAEVRKVEVEER